MAVNQINFDEIDWSPLGDVALEKNFFGQGASISLHRIRPGAGGGEPHSHHNEQLVYVISGRCEVRVGEEVTELGPGSVLSIPPNVPHTARVLGDEDLVNLDIFVPGRPRDFDHSTLEK